MINYPDLISSWINGKEYKSGPDKYIKFNPATGEKLCEVLLADKQTIDLAINSAVSKFNSWSRINVVDRAKILRNATLIIQERKTELAKMASLEAGKSFKDGLGEINAAIEMGFFVSGEGQRYYGKVATSAVENRISLIKRQPIGAAVLITPANNPLAGIAWKAFPALLCGNTVIAKPSENTPYMDILFAEILGKAGLPKGVFSVIQGTGKSAGSLLVEDDRIDLISFTGSVPVGKYIQTSAGKRLAKVSLELGGKNALVVCDDADLEKAAESAVLSAFSSAGQRCAAGSRIIIFESIYEKFKQIMLDKTNKLKIGVSDNDDLGPVISERQLSNIDSAVNAAVSRGAKLLIGGKKLTGEEYKKGYYYTPTILENVFPEDEISEKELFGPVTVLYKVTGFGEALDLTNQSNLGLTAAIHTSSIHRSEVFQESCRTGVVSVNGATYGSEPHMPFGGLKLSGNGWREAGTESLDFFSDWKTIYIKYFSEKIN